jgi:hypothetical protein
MKKLFTLALLSGMTALVSPPSFASHHEKCDCSEQCQKDCQKGHGEKCKCKECDCAKTGKCDKKTCEHGHKHEEK